MIGVVWALKTFMVFECFELQFSGVRANPCIWGSNSEHGLELLCRISENLDGKNHPIDSQVFGEL